MSAVHSVLLPDGWYSCEPGSYRFSSNSNDHGVFGVFSFRVKGRDEVIRGPLSSVLATKEPSE